MKREYNTNNAEESIRRNIPIYNFNFFSCILFVVDISGRVNLRDNMMYSSIVCIIFSSDIGRQREKRESYVRLLEKLKPSKPYCASLLVKCVQYKVLI